MKKKIYYWSPFLSQIATSKSVINSAISLCKYSDEYETSILNFFGEFNSYKNELSEKKIGLINYYKLNFSKYLPFKGKISSRLSFILFFILGFFPLKKILKMNNPEFIIIHLITSLPLFLLLIFDFKTKFILRISGMPRMNFFRKTLWKLSLKKVYCVTCPTQNTLNYLKDLNIVDENKLKLLYDPVLEVRKISKMKKQIVHFNDYFLSVGRLSKQKNFIFLCKAFKEVVKKYPNIKLLIAGEGEDENILKNFINKNRLNKNIFLIGFKKNIFSYFDKCLGFILTSKWEDPGFVLIEAAFCRTPILSSNSWPGPVELIKDKKNGYVYESNNIDSFLENFDHLVNGQKKNQMILNGIIMSKNFTQFNHFKCLNKILNF